MTWGPFHVGVHVVLLAAIPSFGVPAGLFLLTSATPENCAYATSYLPDATLFMLGIAAFFGGHLLQMSDHGSIPHANDEAWNPSKKWRRAAMLVLFLALAAIALLEALGTARVSIDGTTTATFLPITYYTRCAISHDFARSGLSSGVFSVVGITVIFFLAGHWFWAQEPGQDPAGSQVRRARGRKRS